MPPIPSVISVSSGDRSRFSSRLLNGVRVAALAVAASTVLLAQTNPADTPNGNDRRRGGGGQGDAGGDRRNLSPQDVQARMIASMRERLEVPDDDEWKVISERVMKVMELRRNAGGGGLGFMAFGGRGGQGGGGGQAGGDFGGRAGRGGGNSELAALQAAVRDKLPDAEIKSRLDRMRESRKNSEAQLVKAQEDLRAVLSVRQEAMAVLAGLLP